MYLELPRKGRSAPCKAGFLFAGYTSRTIGACTGRGVAKMTSGQAELLTLAAEQGDAEAQYELGVMHLGGRGVAQDDKRAAALLELAADQGHAEAQCYLGVMHLGGHGVARDDKRAAALLKLAADQGRALAQRQLGGMHFSGQEWPKMISGLRSCSSSLRTKAMPRRSLILESCTWADAV